MNLKSSNILGDKVNEKQFLKDMIKIKLPKFKDLNLLYKGSQNGFKQNDFHSRCDNKGPTLTIVEDVNGQIFGGYVSCSWNSYGGWTRDSSAFLFSLTNKSVYPIKTQDNAIVGHSLYLFEFGNFDLCLHDNETMQKKIESRAMGKYDIPESTHGGSILFGKQFTDVKEVETY